MIIPYTNDGIWCMTLLGYAQWFGGIQRYESILGAPLLRNVVAVFDIEKKEVAFAPSA